VLARGGVYIAGGIAPRILPLLERDDFLRGFFDKGRFRALMRRIPVAVVLNEKTALMGAARTAARLAETSPAA
jgi:glucokinase